MREVENEEDCTAATGQKKADTQYHEARRAVSVAQLGSHEKHHADAAFWGR